MRLGVFDHTINIRLGEAARRLDADLLLLAGRLVLGRNLHDAVGVDVEGHLDLRHAARGRGDAYQVELAEQFVIGRHLTLALEHADRDRGLIVFGGRKGLTLLRRNRRVAIDQPGEHTAQGLDPERQWGHVEKQNVLDLALQNTRLDRRPNGHDLVRVDASIGFLAEELLDDFDDLGHAGHPADQDHLIDLGGLEPRILEGAATWPDRPLDQVVDQGLELCPGQLDIEMLRPVLVRRDEGQIDVGLHRR